MSSKICSLGEVELAERIDFIRREVLPHAIKQTEHPGGFRWEFEPDGPLRATLEDLANLERDCCPSGEFNLREDPTTGTMIFEAHGLESESNALLRLAKRLGIAGLVSFLICCVGPFLLVAIFGVGIAAPLAGLDDPWIISGATILLATAFWLFERRSRRSTSLDQNSASDLSDCDC